ncbi:glycosyltransferase family 2 protein [Hymenobacter sp. DH14]|uniref:Glycosyltransferase family 2 protein n=1 Tax=Hymenobacter cyanobacteriorum TaxID=2926463 RepID=A0A9X1VGR7_9BACT|nr:glycosyltransferase [Hymenobacter cyanobacteriorum]MCI1188899.1 glycosyltransferase family 2 protein [Hymenobacter cyanobacteriorum]
MTDYSLPDTAITHVGATLLVCTYNGALRLPQTLAHLAAQRVPVGMEWEVVLVSNASTDDTLVVAPQLWAELGAPTSLRVFDEPKPGKENALIRGFDEARYPYICTVDDDNWLYPDYLAQAVATMQAYPEIGTLGAYAEGAYEVAPPAWFEQFKAVYAIGSPSPTSGPLARGVSVAGAGSVIPKRGWQLLRACGFEFNNSAKRGAVLSGSEDVELGCALQLAGYTTWYDERLRFRHFMYKERLNWDYLRRVGRGSATSNMTDLVYYFLLREPALDAATFGQRYYRWLAWTAWQLLRNPARILTYWLHRHDEAYPETFETMRQLHTFRCALTGRAEALRIFSIVKKLQQRLQTATIVPNPTSASSTLSPPVRTE